MYKNPPDQSEEEEEEELKQWEEDDEDDISSEEAVTDDEKLEKFRKELLYHIEKRVENFIPLEGFDKDYFIESEFEEPLRDDPAFQEKILDNVLSIDWTELDADIAKFIDFYTMAELREIVSNLHLYSMQVEYDQQSRYSRNTNEHEVLSIPIGTESESIWQHWEVQELEKDIGISPEIINDKEFWEDLIDDSPYKYSLKAEFNKDGTFEDLVIDIDSEAALVVTIYEDRFLEDLSNVETAEEPVKKPQIVYTFQDGSFVVKLNPRNLMDEGRRMGHCVAGHGYPEKLIADKIQLYSVRTAGGRSRFTIEVDEDGDIPQVKGKANRLPGFTPALSSKYNNIHEELFAYYPNRPVHAATDAIITPAAELALQKEILPEFKVYEVYQLAEFIVNYIFKGEWAGDFSELFVIDDFEPAAMIMDHFDLPKPNPGIWGRWASGF